MELFKKITANTIFVLQVLIVFVLLFESNIQVPALLQSFGRMHPLLLHLPIGLLIVTAILVFTKQLFDGPAFAELIVFLLYLTSLFASLTTLMGLFLAYEGGYEDEVLMYHKWFGVALSFFCWLLISPKIFGAIRFTLVMSVALLLLAGHFGATLTHGDRMVLEPLMKQERNARVISDSSTLFSAVIEPVLESRCSGCHNPDKSKGNLILTTTEGFMKGGKSGKLVEKGDADKSLIVKRLFLPLHDKKHMPPKDKVQPTDEELSFITEWINRGADLNLRVGELHEQDTLKKLSDHILAGYLSNTEPQPLYNFRPVSAEKVRELSIPNRTVFQIAKNEPALEADFYLKDHYDEKYLEELLEVRDQVVAINLSKMPFEDSHMPVIARFRNLRKLVLNYTHIKGATLGLLADLPNLEVLSLSGTAVTPDALLSLTEVKSLREVFIWNTDVTGEACDNLRRAHPRITWHTGYTPDENEILKLNAPLLANDGNILATREPILLKHNLPGTTIRYTTDNNKPDSMDSHIYQEGIFIDGYTLVKAKAFKDGWRSSDIAEYVFFRKGIPPLQGRLLSKSEPKYEGDGINTLMDFQKGMPDFFKDPSWVGFRSEPLTSLFFFDGKEKIKAVTISYAKNIGAMCMPPYEVEVWGGKDEKELHLLNKVRPAQPDGWVSNRTEGVSVSLPPEGYQCVKVVARPLAKLPEFRKEKKQKGWLMVDEIFFN